MTKTAITAIYMGGALTIQHRDGLTKITRGARAFYARHDFSFNRIAARAEIEQDDDISADELFDELHWRFAL